MNLGPLALAIGAVAAGLLATSFLLIRGGRRRDRARVVGDRLLGTAGQALHAEFRPAPPPGWTGYQAPFGTLHGKSQGLTYTLTINDGRTGDVGYAAHISVEPPADARFVVTLDATRLADVRPGTTIADLFGRRRAQRVPPPAHEPLLRIAAVSADFGIADRSLAAHSRPSVWRWSDNAEPGPLVDFATTVLASAAQLLRAD